MGHVLGHVLPYTRVCASWRLALPHMLFTRLQQMLAVFAYQAMPAAGVSAADGQGLYALAHLDVEVVLECFTVAVRVGTICGVFYARVTEVLPTALALVGGVYECLASAAEVGWVGSVLSSGQLEQLYGCGDLLWLW